LIEFNLAASMAAASGTRKESLCNRHKIGIFGSPFSLIRLSRESFDERFPSAKVYAQDCACGVARANSGSPLAIGLSTSQVPDPVWAFSGTLPVINTVTVKITGCE